MAHIEKKIVKGRAYYYACQKGRVDGKPRNIWQKYLGTAEQMLRQAQGHVPQKEEPISADIAEFGGVAALLDIAQRLRLVEIINRQIPENPRTMSVGDYMLLAAINRCLSPKSKRQMAAWYAGTSLPRLLGFQASQLTSQRFWDHMQPLTEERIRAIENELSAHMISEFQLDLDCLLYDATNFFTFIDTFTAGELAQRGKNKQGRGNLRQVGLALLVTRDFHVPLLHETYPGNRHDAKTFGSVTEQLVERYQALATHCEDITLVFDKGNNSEENLNNLEQTAYHFVGSLVPTHFQELLTIPLTRFKAADQETLAGIKTYRTRQKVFGIERTVVITHNDTLLEKQSRSMALILAKARRQLNTLQARVRRARKRKGGKKPTAEGIHKQIKKIISPRHLKDLFEIDLKKDRWGFSLTYRLRRNELTKLTNRLFGKKILFSDREDWTDEALVLAYHGQAGIEEAFKRMKDPYFLCWHPQYHWTDPMIKVHGFYCVLALTMASLLRRELDRAGIKMSIPKMFQQLREIREVALIYPQHKPRGRQSTKSPINHTAQTQNCMVLSTLSPDQERLFTALKLSRFLPVNATKSRT